MGGGEEEYAGRESTHCPAAARPKALRLEALSPAAAAEITDILSLGARFIFGGLFLRRGET